MKSLLENEFVAHYNSQKDKPVNITIVLKNTKQESFGLKDDDVMLYTKDEGIAKYENPDKTNIHILNYERYLKALPPRVKNALETSVCDLIVYNEYYFLFNELTDTKPEYVQSFTNKSGEHPGKLHKAQSQLAESLRHLLAVSAIKQYIQKHPVKRCCFFNKQPNAPKKIEAVRAFNRQNELARHGFKMTNEAIESLGFEFWTFAGEQFFRFSEVRS